MSSKQVKDHFGEFVETALREPVILTRHGRDLLVTQAAPNQSTSATPKALDDFLGKGREYSAFKTPEEVIRFIRELRGDEP